MNVLVCDVCKRKINELSAYYSVSGSLLTHTVDFCTTQCLRDYANQHAGSDDER